MQRNAALALLSILLLVAASPPPPAGFNPPLNRQFRHIKTEERSDPSGKQSYRLERSLTFAARDDGIIVTVRPISGTLPQSSQPSTLFATGLGNLFGQTIVLRLDRQGTPTGIDDEAAVWSALLEGIGRVVGQARPPRSGQPPPPRQIAAALAALPPTSRFALLRGLLPPIIGPRLSADDLGATKPVTITARSPAGAPIMLVGEEQYRQASDGFIVIETRASGDFPASGVQPAAHVVTERFQRIDPRTGLIMEGRERRETTLGTGAAAPRSLVIASAKLQLVS